MAEYGIRITRQARDHLREIRRYIEMELLAPIAAKNTIAVIKAEMQSLKEMPSAIHLTPEQGLTFANWNLGFHFSGHFCTCF